MNEVEEAIRRRQIAVAKLGQDEPVTFESLKEWRFKHNGRVVTRSPDIDERTT